MSKNNVYKRIISSGWASSKYNFMKYNVLLRYTLSRSVVIVMLSYYHTQVCFENMSFNKSRSNHLRCSVCVYLCICVCLCVCVCVCVCVYVYSFIVKSSSVCKMFETYLKGTDQRCYVVSIIPDASTKFLDLHFWKCQYFTSKGKTLPRGQTGEKWDDIFSSRKDDI